jgi:hypothetical protein
MASSFLTLADLIEINDQNLLDIDDMSDLLDEAPFLAALSAEIASNGTQHKFTVEDGAPAVGFRDNKKSSDRLVTADLQILSANFHCDQQLAKNYKKGEAAYMFREGKRHLKAAFAANEKQIFYGAGTGGDSDGFIGLAQATTVDALSDVDHVVNAGGSTVGGATSVWAIRSTNDGMDVQALIGQDGQIEIGEYYPQMMLVDDKYLPCYVCTIEGYCGLQTGTIHSFARIVNLTRQEGKGLSDSLMSQLLEKFPSSKQPTHFVMNKQSGFQLQRSRTATTDSGKDAEVPKEYQGIPIIMTDSIITTEALVA